MLVKVGAAEKKTSLQTSTSSVPWRIASLYLNICLNNLCNVFKFLPLGNVDSVEDSRIACIDEVNIAIAAEFMVDIHPPGSSTFL